MHTCDTDAVQERHLRTLDYRLRPNMDTTHKNKNKTSKVIVVSSLTRSTGIWRQRPKYTLLVDETIFFVHSLFKCSQRASSIAAISFAKRDSKIIV